MLKQLKKNALNTQKLAGLLGQLGHFVDIFYLVFTYSYNVTFN